MHQIQLAVVWWGGRGQVSSSFFCLRDVQVSCTEEFHYHIMALRFNMACHPQRHHL